MSSSTPPPAAARCWLTSPRLPWLLMALSVLLTLPGLWTGWQVDDWFHQALLQGVSLPVQSGEPWSGMFDFLSNEPARAAKMRNFGFAPWWLPDSFQVRFFRPVTVATHVFDHLVAPTSAVFAHAHSIAWSAAVVALVTLLFQRFHGLTAVAGVAALLYALDESRGIPSGWVANRNALVTLFFGVACLLAHDRWRREKWLPGSILGPLLFTMALLAAEAGIATTAYLLGYALFMDRGPLWRRLTSLAPFLLIVVIWRLIYNAYDFGAAGSGLYIDPVAHPLRFFVAAIRRWPLLMAGQWISAPTIIISFLPPVIISTIIAISVVFMGGIGLLLRPILQVSASARMWLTGMMLSAIPICATFPANRLLGFVGLGGAALLAQLADHYGRPGLTWLRQRGGGLPHPRRAMLVRCLTLLPLSAGFITLPVSTYSISILADELFNPCERATTTDPSIRGKTVVFVNANALCVGYMPVRRLVLGINAPAHVRLLASIVHEVHVTGVDSHTIDVRAVGGFHSHPGDQLMRSGDDPLPVGHRVKMVDMQVEVLRHTPAGLVDSVRVHFLKPLTDPSLVWVAMDKMVGRPFIPPKPDEKVVLPGVF